MSRIEVTKIHPSIALGSANDGITVPKIVAYVLLVPGDGGEAGTNFTAQSQGQTFRKRT